MQETNCCKEYSAFDIYKVIYNLKTKQSDLAESALSRTYYGYGCEIKELEQHQIAQNLIDSLSYVKKQALQGEVCVSCDIIQKLIERAKNINPEPCVEVEDIKKDESNKELHLLKNPYCISRERYEKLAYQVCNDLKVTFKTDISTNSCKLSYDIAFNKVNCELLTTFSFIKLLCDLNYNIKYTKKDCKLDYELLVKKFNCDLSFNTYFKLIKCNISPSFIFSTYKNGCGLSVDEQDAVVLQVEESQYLLEDFDFSNYTAENCEDCKYIESSTDQSTVDRMRQEYRVSDDEFRKIEPFI